MASDSASVKFLDIKSSYSLVKDIDCIFQYRQDVEPSDKDFIGLYQNGLLISSCNVKENIVTSIPNYKVTIQVDGLSLSLQDLCQFMYVREGESVLGCSTKFKVYTTENIEPDLSEDDDLNSFIFIEPSAQNGHFVALSEFRDILLQSEEYKAKILQVEQMYSSEKSEHNKVLEDLRIKVELLEKELSAKKEQCIKTTSQLEKEKDLIKDLKKGFICSEEKINMMTLQLEEERNLNKDLKKELVCSEEKITLTTSQLKTENKLVKDLKEELICSEDKINVLNAENETKEKTCLALNSELSMASSLLQFEKCQVNKLKKNLTDFEEKVSDLSGQLEDKGNENNRLKEQLESKEEKLQTMTKKNSDLESEFMNIWTNLQMKQEEISFSPKTLEPLSIVHFTMSELDQMKKCFGQDFSGDSAMYREGHENGKKEKETKKSECYTLPPSEVRQAFVEKECPICGMVFSDHTFTYVSNHCNEHFAFN